MSFQQAPHTGNEQCTEISSLKHRVEYTCCNGYTTAPHFFENINGQLKCEDCGYVSNNLLNIEEEEIN